jgi:Ca2+-binding EF-hand superfamily protein
MNDVEIFSLIDKDSDGLISLEDFKHFVIDTLGISKIEFNNYKLERVMQSISLSKNKNIGLGDIREFMNKSLANGINSYYVDLKETFKETTNQNLYRGKKNTEWITQAIERLGMYITEKYDGAEKFFEKFADTKLNKFKLEHFINFHENNYECFHGFNLTRDELLAIFTSLDSQKKNYLTLEDLKNKIELFDFYRKMHVDIKNFLHNNFPTQVDSFKFFLPTNLNKMNKPGGSGLMAIDSDTQKVKRGNSFNRTFTKGFYRPFDSSGIINSQASGTLLMNSYKIGNKNNNTFNNKKLLNYMTKKQFFDGINTLFPQKYPTDTILKYMKKYFNIDISKPFTKTSGDSEQKITFSQYVFVYYGKVCNDNDLFLGNLTKNTNNFSTNNYSSSVLNNLASKRHTKISNTRTSITARCQSAFEELNTKNTLGRVPYAHNLYPNEEEIIGPHPLTHMDHPLEYLAHEKLLTPFDDDPLEKVRRVIVSSPNQNYIDKMKKFLDEHKISGGICNEFEFKNMLKSLYLGLTNVEIDDIIRRSGKTYDGKLNMNNFFQFVTSKDRNINKAANNLSQTLGEIKQLLYKYYSNPKLAFTFIDSSQSNLMDFEKYRAIITELYKREDRPMPNFALLKNTYDYIDLRKDGLIDMVEWTNAFGNMKGKLDAFKPKNTDHKKQIQKLRKWETSNDVINIYKEIAKNRKIISQKIKDTSFGTNYTIIHEDNLINVLRDIFPYYRLTNTQWKMIVEIGNRDTQGFVNFDTFIKLVENCARRDEMPRLK